MHVKEVKLFVMLDLLFFATKCLYLTTKDSNMPRHILFALTVLAAAHLAPLASFHLVAGNGSSAVSGFAKGASLAASNGGSSLMAMVQDVSTGAVALSARVSHGVQCAVSGTITPLLASVRDSVSDGVKACRRLASRWPYAWPKATASLSPRHGALPSSESLRDIINATCTKYGMEEALIMAVVRAESNFNPRAVSPKGARGLMQLMPATARELGVTNSLDPAENIDGGVRYLKWLLGVFDNDTELALAAYNAGPTKVRRYKGIPPYRETKTYVKRVLRFYEHYAAG